MTKSDKGSDGKDKGIADKIKPEVTKTIENVKAQSAEITKKISETFKNAADLSWIKNQSKGIGAKLPDPKNFIAALKQKIDLKSLTKNLNLKSLISNFSISGAVNQIKCTASKMSEGAPIGRPMKFPYTFSAKIAQFPMKFYIQNQWIWRYYAISFAACIPLFYSIHKLANSPGNVSKWAEIRRKEALEHHH